MYINSVEAIRAADKMAKIEGMGQRSWICEYQRPCVQVPHGPWPKDPKLVSITVPELLTYVADIFVQKELGAWNQLQAMEGLEGWTMAPFCRVLGWSLEEVQVHLAGAQKDYCDPNIHAYIPL